VNNPLWKHLRRWNNIKTEGSRRDCVDRIIWLSRVQWWVYVNAVISLPNSTKVALAQLNNYQFFCCAVVLLVSYRKERSLVSTAHIVLCRCLNKLPVQFISLHGQSDVDHYCTEEWHLGEANGDKVRSLDVRWDYMLGVGVSPLTDWKEEKCFSCTFGDMYTGHIPQLLFLPSLCNTNKLTVVFPSFVTLRF
jgi:hypothetical protein